MNSLVQQWNPTLLSGSPSGKIICYKFFIHAHKTLQQEVQKETNGLSFYGLLKRELKRFSLCSKA